ncbi:hypothetical protein GCM10022210_34160 [Mucilaginibacter dorajii]|uniref:Uncharacterized protein n=1 Tax=Mucilaginibacter dorajii TaxID=692994 RepID=A0ABP7QD63_9SPHI
MAIRGNGFEWYLVFSDVTGNLTGFAAVKQVMEAIKHSVNKRLSITINEFDLNIAFKFYQPVCCPSK